MNRAIVAAVGATVVLLVALFVATLVASRAEQETRKLPPSIRVVGKLWWWEVTYLDGGSETAFVTANELRIPAGRPIRVELVSDNVIHSLWVPRLAGKVDLIPGRINGLTLHATEPGVFRGQCAEFCGLQHAKMALFVVAEPEEAFTRWKAGQREAARQPVTAQAVEGLGVFFSAGCWRCHTIRGVSQSVEPGPDLTHLASRLSLAAGTLHNRRGHLAGWISNPQALKPGNKMPRLPLTSGELHAIVAFLETLE